MIYLFDDSVSRLKSFLGPNINSRLCSNLVFDCEKEQIAEFYKERMPRAEVVIFHKSYMFPRKGITLVDVESFFVNNNIHFVEFSGSSSTNMFIKNGIQHAEMNSNEMYMNLTKCLDLDEKIDFVFPQLVYGKNYLRNILRGMEDEIISSFFSKTDLSSDDLYEILDIVSSYMCKFEEFSEDKLTLENWINKKIQVGSVSIETLQETFDRLIDRY